MTYIAPNLPGTALPANSVSVGQPSQNIVGTAQATPAAGYEFLTNSINGWFDALGFSWISFTISTDAGVTGGVVSFESTNDPTSAPNGVQLPMLDSVVLSPTARFANVTLAAGTTRQFDGGITGRYIRIRVSTTVPSGTVTVAATMRQSPPSSSAQVIFTNLAAITSSTTNTIGTVRLLIPSSAGVIGYATLTTISTADVTAAAITATTLTAAVQPITMPPSASFCVTVTAVSGTGPTLDVVVRESYDGNAYNDLYHFERITTTGTFVSPVISIGGQYLKYNMVVGGTSPSFNPAIVRLSKASPGANLKQYYSRTIDPNTIGSTTSAYNANGAVTVHVSVSSAAATSACTIALQGSVDGTTWYTISSVASVANTVTQITTSGMGKWLRGYVSVAGSGQTLNYVHITGIGPS